MLVEELQQRRRLFHCPAHEMTGEARIYIEQLASGLRVRNDNRVRDIADTLWIAQPVAHLATVLGRLAKDVLVAVYCLQRLERLLQPRRECLVRGTYVGETGVTTCWGNLTSQQD